MQEAADPQSHTIELTADEVQLIRAALRLLLDAEDDIEEIRQIKSMLARLPAK